MSHFAEIDETNTVLRVLVGDNNDPAGDEGYSWLIDNLGGTWIKTSYNSKIRKNFASVGGKYDPVDDAFIPPMPECGHDTLELKSDTYQWFCQTCVDEFNASLPE